jgi:hypothetical protein
MIGKASIYFTLLISVTLLDLGCNVTGSSPTTKNPPDSLNNDSTGTDIKGNKNLIIVTLDGFRWEDVFRGADSSLFFGRGYTSGNASELKAKFWGTTESERREKLLPFIWSVILQNGRIYGNRDLGSDVNVSNPYWFSYPGYNEIFTGYPDPRVNSNDYGPNPNLNVLEFLNGKKNFKGEVAAFCKWDAFYRILNQKRSGLNIVAGVTHKIDSISTYFDNHPPAQQEMNNLDNLPIYGGYSHLKVDEKVYASAKAYIKEKHPRVFYLSFAGTDDFGHQDKYHAYLSAAHNIDVMVHDLWDYIEKDSFYKGKTTLFITVDHGRGENNHWRSHGKDIPHSDQIWFAVMGPETHGPFGEMKHTSQIYQKQFAATFARFVGQYFTSPVQSIAPSIKEITGD